jgi:IclR family KDG regulon transcriptional repressor
MLGMVRRMSKNTVKSVDRALNILCIIGESTTPVAIKGLSEYLGLPRTTLYATLNSLENFGFIARHEDTRSYRLGWRAYVLGMEFLKRRIDHSAVEEARTLTYKWNYSSNISVYVGNNRVAFLHTELPNKPHLVLPRLGYMSWAHSTASGKVLLAYLGKTELDRVLARELEAMTPYTITDPARLAEELAKIREQGWALDDQESVLGLGCMAVPIRDALDRCVGAISVSGSIDEIKASMEEISDDLLATAKRISQIPKAAILE